ncbi:MAG: hypothetical protein M1503_08070 [Thaumarchaeota archaeon]|nr:hypothetical protein [Nitrososphaerota archaeon]MCL5318196.1 hypothetical protein [Nitrososphaerota archaeon]
MKLKSERSDKDEIELDVAGFFSNVDLFMTVFFVATVTLIMFYEYNLHHRAKKTAH